MGRRGDQRSNIDDFSGLGFRQPVLAASLTVFMLSLAGIPTTAGFLGKFFIFRAAIESKLVGLAVIGVINSAISVYYYLRVIVVMYMRESPEELPRVAVSPGVGSVIAVAVGGIILLGLKPDWIIYLARSSALSF